MISAYMTEDHRRCDGLFADIERGLVKGEQSAGTARLDSFIAAMEQHFTMEEEVLFPAFEEQTGMSMGPTAVMRHEHAQMRQLFGQMREALAQGDADSYLGIAETLLMLMQQHNIKEEQVLYPMTDRTLAAQSDEVMRRMQQLGDN